MMRCLVKNAVYDDQKKAHSKFSETLAPLMVALMQFFAGIFTETINILSICNLKETKDVIMNFIALGVISEIDNYYLLALPSDGI